MPKSSLKQKNNKYNSEADNNSNIVFIDIKPFFPPTLTTNDLIKNALKSGTYNTKQRRFQTLLSHTGWH